MAAVSAAILVNFAPRIPENSAEVNYLSDQIRQLSPAYFPLQRLMRFAKGSFRQGLASISLTALRLFAQITRIKPCGGVGLVLVASCTNTQVRWDAVKMRQDVMVYYNDQIMENLIKAKNHLPFVHVDIQTLTSAGASQITGSMGYGETVTNTGTHAQTNQTTTTDTSSPPGAPATMRTVAKVAGGLVATATHTAMRPFSYSVSPLRSETLTITAAPALGAQAQASPAPAATPTLTLSRVTDTTDKNDATKTVKNHTEEKTLISPPQEAPKTIYDLYQDFADSGHLSQTPTKPPEGAYLPGTLKKWSTKQGTKYYFVADDEPDKTEYYEFCKKLFIKGSGGSLEQKVQEIRGQFESLKATPPL